MPMPRAYSWLKEGDTCRFCIGSGAALGGRCKHCAGLGKTFEGQPRQPCELCDGQGKLKSGEPCGACGAKGWEAFEARPTVACRFCMGSGNSVGGTCKHCEGAGRLELDADGNVIDLLLTAKAREQKCPECLGIGYRARGASCDTCGGTGKKVLTAAQYAAQLKAQGGGTGPKPAASQPLVPAAPPISQGNPLAQSKFGAAKFCMGSGNSVGGTCKHCEGAGRLELDADGNVIDLLLTAKAREQKCPECLGIGYRARGASCDTCGGTGKKVLTAAQYAAQLKAQGGGTGPKPAASQPLVPAAPPISQGNPLAQSKFGAAKFCMACGTGIKPEANACPKCGKPVNAPSREDAKIRGTPAPAATPAQTRAQSMFQPPQYCKGCGTAFKAGITHCPKCGKPATTPT